MCFITTTYSTNGILHGFRANRDYSILPDGSDFYEALDPDKDKVHYHMAASGVH